MKKIGLFITITSMLLLSVMIFTGFKLPRKLEPREEITVEPWVPYEEREAMDTEEETTGSLLRPKSEENYIFDAETMAKCCWGEARGCPTIEQKAAVYWCILNRVDDGQGDIYHVITAPYQFSGYSSGNPVDSTLLDLAYDVLARWQLEKEGQTDVGRILPREYTYFSGNGRINIFRDQYSGCYNVWDWSLPSPYEGMIFENE